MLSLCVGSLGPSGLKIVPTFTEQMSRLLSTSAARLGNERLLYEESGASKVSAERSRLVGIGTVLVTTDTLFRLTWVAWSCSTSVFIVSTAKC